MKLILILSLTVYGVESQIVNQECIEDYNTAEKEVLKNNIGSPYQLAIDYDTDTLFFSYTSENSGKSTFELMYADINLKTNEFKTVNGIAAGFANAVDQNKHIVYLGGENGIYIYDYETNQAKHIDGTSHKIWQMFYKKDLYYTTYPKEEVYLFKNGHFQGVPQLRNTRAMLIAVDNSDNIYFTNSSGLFVYEENNQKTITYVGDYNINGFTSDVNGNLIFSTPTAIFAIDSNNKLVRQLILIDDIYGVAIEYNGNIIYASEDSIVRLKRTKTLC